MVAAVGIVLTVATPTLATTDILAGRTPTCSSQYDGFECVNITDSDDGTLWVSQDVTPVSVEFHGLDGYTVTGFRIVQGTGGNGRVPFVIYSWDGSIWTERASSSEYGTVTGSIDNITAEGWLLQTTAGGNGWQVFTWELQGDVAASATPMPTASDTPTPAASGEFGPVDISSFSGQALDTLDLLIWAVVLGAGLVVMMGAWIAVQGMRR